MRLLVLGGTGFVGRHIVDEDALALWITADDADNAGFMRISGARAVAAGLRHRPLGDTARDVRGALRPSDGLGLDPALEARLVHCGRERRE